MEKWIISDILHECQNLDDAETLSYMKDIANYGCSSGTVSSLIYYNQTEAFFRNFSIQILGMVSEFECDSITDPNDLAWLAYENTVQKLLEELEGTPDQEFDLVKIA
ncbi:hypothetical protein ACFHWD_03860 [Clostridium sp. MT-14]|uniref:DUF7222 domain-containing protein n=1 Tax=Clostridium sp. MT-14 TaxID=3348360 RepID=UPI0035F265F1